MLGLPFPPARRDSLFVFLLLCSEQAASAGRCFSLPIYWLCSAAGGEFGLWGWRAETASRGGWTKKRSRIITDELVDNCGGLVINSVLHGRSHANTLWVSFLCWKRWSDRLRSGPRLKFVIVCMEFGSEFVQLLELRRAGFFSSYFFVCLWRNVRILVYYSGHHLLS